MNVKSIQLQLDILQKQLALSVAQAAYQAEMATENQKAISDQIAKLEAQLPAEAPQA